MNNSVAAKATEAFRNGDPFGFMLYCSQIDDRIMAIEFLGKLNPEFRSLDFTLVETTVKAGGVLPRFALKGFEVASPLDLRFGTFSCTRVCIVTQKMLGLKSATPLLCVSIVTRLLWRAQRTDVIRSFQWPNTRTTRSIQ